MADNPVWLERLIAYEAEGFHEVPGPASNPKILKWAHGAGHAKWVTDDATPWCGIGLAGVMDECALGHVVPKDPALAISWLRCGVPCDVRVGAIAVFPRTGGNHVTVVKEIRGSRIDCIGCNQGDAIRTDTYQISAAKGFRWPVPLKTPAEMVDESRIAAAAARQKRDQVIAGGSGSTIPITAPTASPDVSTAIPAAKAPAPPEVVPAPLPKGLRQSVDNILGDFTWFKGAANGVIDFGAFIGTKWWFVAGGIALYFLARSFWDSHQIQQWRTQDQNEGRSQ